MKTYITGSVLARNIEQNMERVMEEDNNGLNVLNRLEFVIFPLKVNAGVVCCYSKACKSLSLNQERQ